MSAPEDLARHAVRYLNAAGILRPAPADILPMLAALIQAQAIDRMTAAIQAQTLASVDGPSTADLEADDIPEDL